MATRIIVRRGWAVLFLVALSSLVQGIAMHRSVTSSLDSARFAIFARQIDDLGFRDALASQWEQPLFPTVVWLTKAAIETTIGHFPAIFGASVQWASAIAVVAAVVPFYLFARRILGRKAGLAAGVLFCILPSIARLGVSGASDSWHLLFFCSALWTMAHCIEVPPGQTWRAFAWTLGAGVAVGLGLLTRAEILVLAASFAAMLGAAQFVPSARRPWSVVGTTALGFALGSALAIGPYLALVGVGSFSAAKARLLGEPDPARPHHTTDGWQLADGSAMSFAPKDPSTSIRKRGWITAAFRFSEEMVKAFWFATGLCGLYAGWQLRKHRARAVDRWLQLFCVLFALALYGKMAMEGYGETRHFVPLVVVGLGVCGWGAVALGQRMRIGGATTVAVLAIFCALKTCSPAYYAAAAHRQAGEWLAQNAPPASAVIDTRGWTGLASGHRTYIYFEGLAAVTDPAVRYVVVMPQELQPNTARAKTLATLLAASGEPVAQFHGRPDSRDDDVFIYRWTLHDYLAAQSHPPNGAVLR